MISSVKEKIFNHPINVSSVPQLSIFRYPGGKTWFIPYLRIWMQSLNKVPEILYEPFAGGGIVSLTSISENLVKKVHVNEIDPMVSAVWKTSLCSDFSWLCERIVSFDINYSNVMEVLQSEPKNTREQSFKTILKNRCAHGGILADGGGLIKRGENGKGISSRWYPTTLVRRIQRIYSMRSRIIFTEEDGLDILQKDLNNESAIYFLDPPYTAGKKGKRAGRRLYRFADLNHKKLFKISSQIKGNFLMTYDDDFEVKELANSYSMSSALIPMKNTHNSNMIELLISKDLNWIK